MGGTLWLAVTIFLLSDHHRNASPSCLWVYLSFPSLIMLSASQASQKTAGEFSLHPASCGIFGAVSLLLGHGKLLQLSPGFISPADPCPAPCCFANHLPQPQKSQLLLCLRHSLVLKVLDTHAAFSYLLIKVVNNSRHCFYCLRNRQTVTPHTDRLSVLIHFFTNDLVRRTVKPLSSADH